MSNFIKHVGRHGDQKVIVVFRKVPNEDHMCLVTYVDKLPVAWHDSIMSVLESKAGQDAKEFSEVLHRNTLPDGQNMLLALHKGYQIKKVQTSQIVVTPNNKSSVRLDQLNEMLDKIAAGGDAAKKLADTYNNVGLTKQPTKKEIFAREKQAAAKADRTTVAENWTGLTAGDTAVLSDADIANNLRSQSVALSNQAKGLLAEAERLMTEANSLAPVAPTEGAPAKRQKATPDWPPAQKVAKKRTKKVASV